MQKLLPKGRVQKNTRPEHFVIRSNPTWQLNQKQPLIPAFEMPVTGQGSPFFPSALQPQPLVRSFEMPVAGQGTTRPAANARTARANQDKDDWVSDIVDNVTDVVDVVLDNRREERQPPKTLDDFRLKLPATVDTNDPRIRAYREVLDTSTLFQKVEVKD